MLGGRVIHNLNCWQLLLGEGEMKLAADESGPSRRP